MSSETAKETLVADLQEVSAPESMIELAKLGFYDDFESPSATPIMDLVSQAARLGLYTIVHNAKEGKYDA